MTFAPQVNPLPGARRRRHCLYVRLQQAEHALSGRAAGSAAETGQAGVPATRRIFIIQLLRSLAKHDAFVLSLCAMVCSKLQQTM